MLLSSEHIDYKFRYCLVTILCVFLTNIVSTRGSSVTLKPNYDFDNYKVFEYKQAKLVLSCGNGTDSKLDWFKDSDPIKESDRFKLEGQSLSIEKPTDQDAGKYRCVNSTSNSSESFDVISRPYVKLPENTIVVEGETLTLDCTGTGIPAPTIVWKIGDIVYNESRDNVQLLPNSAGVKNAILKIKDVTMNDRNTYTCFPTNIANYDNSTMFKGSATLVRVKDKLAALWPFLGICVEVLVLCAIILIYEKKRNKAELEESDTDNSPEQKNTPDHGKDSVRHRK